MHCTNFHAVVTKIQFAKQAFYLCVVLRHWRLYYYFSFLAQIWTMVQVINHKSQLMISGINTSIYNCIPIYIY